MKRIMLYGLVASITILLPGMTLCGGEQTKPQSTTDKSADSKPAEQGKDFTVDARVIYGQGSAGYFPPAELDPNDFMVPDGCQAVNLRFGWEDPKTMQRRDKLGASNIYSITQKRYMTEVKGNPQATLPAGQYRFSVGGLPGAWGRLTYTIVKAGDTKTTSDPIKKGERIIDVVVWASTPKSANYNPKQKATYRIVGEKVLGEINQIVEPPKYENGITCDPLPVTGRFVGTISGDVITGKWETKTAAHRMHFPGVNGPPFDRVDKYSNTFESRLVLNRDGTLTETMKGSGLTEWEWGPTAPAGAPGEGKSGSNQYEFSVPSKDMPQPMQGTWKERK